MSISRLAVSLLSLSLALVASGALTVAGEIPTGERSFTFRLDTPPIEALPAEGGFVDLRIEGFGTRERRPGAPDVPTRTILVAIPPGATPRLSVRPTAERTRRSLLPRPAARIVPGSAVEGVEGVVDRTDPQNRLGQSFREIYEPDRELYAGRGTLPERTAWLGEIGVLRDQRYVEVHLAPVRFDRERGQLIVDPGLEVTVHFDGTFAVAGRPAPPDRLESVYRSAFENYAQGRRFRLSALDDEIVPAAGEVRGAFASTGPMRRIRIRQNGPVRLDHGLFTAQAPEFLTSDPRTWRLDNRGEQVPLQIHQEPGNDALLEPGEWVQFYGQVAGGEPETVVSHENPSNPFDNLYEVADFTDENVYFLTIDTQVQPTMTEQDATPLGGPVEPHFVAVTREEVDEHLVPLPDEVWFSLPPVAEGGSRVDTVSLPGLASGTAPARIRVQVRGFPYDCVDVDPDHKTLVGFQNDLSEPLVLPGDNPDNVGNQNVGEFDGNALFLHDFEWTHSGLDPELTDPVHVTLEAAVLDVPCSYVPGGNVINDVFLDYIEIEYRRDFEADNDLLEFRYPDGPAEFEITGFTSSAVEVYEVTNHIGSSDVVDTLRLTGVTVTPAAPTFTVRFRIEDDPDLDPATLRRFVVAGLGGTTMPPPADFEADRVSTLRTETTHADLVVIAHPDLLDSQCSEGGNPCSYDADCTVSPTDRCEITTGSPLDLLLAHRTAQAIDSRVARIRDVEDEFNAGLAGPPGIQNFLAWLMAGGWEMPPPSYVMLLGDGSENYKAGTAKGNYVPTQMIVKLSDYLAYYSSDNQLAAVVGDDSLPEMAVGRVTARTRTKADRILKKILDYEQIAPPGAWRSHTLLISDRGKLRNGHYDADEAKAFEDMNDLINNFVADTAYTTEHLRYWTDNCCSNDGCNVGDGDVPPYNCNAGVMRQDILDALNAPGGDGAVITQYVGHGNFDLWSDDVIFCGDQTNIYCGQDDTASLYNGLKAPWLIAHNCLTGGFHPTDDRTIGEQWLRRSLDMVDDVIGGAVAVYSPSGLGLRYIGTDVIQMVWDDVFGPHKERLLATPVLNSQVGLCTQGSIEPCQYYTLLGDPTTKLALPDVGPPSEVVATASTGVIPHVDLTWDPGSTVGAKYIVYRTEQLNLDYTRISGEDPIDPTSFTDSNVEHTLTYYYYVVATDGGFESARSNFNSDCGEPPGEDCVQAKPVNLVPPVMPTGLTATDAETGGRLDLSWNDNPEGDIDSYTVHYGTTAAYGQTKVVLIGTETSLTGLNNGTPYYIAIQATNSSGTQSQISDPPVIAAPNLVLGVRAPDFITDLRVARSGPDALLTWTAVTQDIYGKPTSVDHYEVFRGVDPQYVPSPAERIGMPTPPTFTDPGALDPVDPNYYYLVCAVDPAGSPGGLGNQLPNGILDLEIERSTMTSGALVLSWSPVTKDFDGNPTQITHYELYAADTPFTRADIEAGAVDLLVPTVTGTSIEIVPTGPDGYYSVLAVDARDNRSPF